MIGRRAVIGLTLLCALAFSAIAASGAMASLGTTAFTCVEVETGKKFSDEHCNTPDTTAGPGFVHEEIKVGETTEIEANNEKTAEETKKSTSPVLESKIAGLGAKITCTTMTSTGDLKNQTVSEKMMVTGTAAIVFGGCKLEGALVTIEKCKLTSETITTVNQMWESVENSMELTFKPNEGNVFSTFKLEGCTTKGLNETTFEVTGDAKAIPVGATLETTKASTEGKGLPAENNGLWLNGQKATFTSKVTVRMKGGHPISMTTTEP
jgi:hypothetical protein